MYQITTVAWHANNTKMMSYMKIIFKTYFLDPNLGDKYIFSKRALQKHQFT